jgi:hypothetical protein
MTHLERRGAFTLDPPAMVVSDTNSHAPRCDTDGPAVLALDLASRPRTAPSRQLRGLEQPIRMRQKGAPNPSLNWSAAAHFNKARNFGANRVRWLTGQN